MSSLVLKLPRSIPSDEESLSQTAREIIVRNLPETNGPPTRQTISKISVDDQLDNSYKEEIVRYMIMVSSLTLDELNPLWRHLSPNYVHRMFTSVKLTRVNREKSDWKPKPLWRQVESDEAST